jgi:fatty-acyl-CoA synthase
MTPLPPMPRIASAEDCRHLASQPYARFMPHTHVFRALDAVARHHPGRVALRFAASGDPAVATSCRTYGELLADIRRAANLFHRLAAPAPARVALLLPPVPEAHTALWAAETAGIAIPMNPLLQADHLAELVQASGANLLVALGPHPQLDIWSRVAGLQARCPGLRQVLAVGGQPVAGLRQPVIDFGLACAGERGDALDFALPDDAHAVAALFHTGGTTGAPKLAQHTHGNQLHAAWGAACHLAMVPDDVIVNGFPLFHVAGAFVYGLSALLSGAQLLLPTALGLRDAAYMQYYWRFVERYRVTLLAAVPTVIGSLLGSTPGDASMASVRALLTGGSPLPTELALAFEQRFGIPVRNILGMTECAGVISIEPFHAPRTPGSCGLPLPFTQVVALNAEGRRCSSGQPGVLRVRGPHVGPGYTDAARNPGTFEDGWLVTGDLGHVDDQGRVFVTGRAKDVIIRSAHNIDPGLIEGALLSHPEVLMAAAVGAPDAYAGELPVAYVSLRPGAGVDAAALARFIAPLIAEPPAMPKHIEVLPDIPVTAVGKVYKPALRALAIRQVLTERLQAAGLGAEVDVAVHDSPGGLAVRLVVQAHAMDRLAPQIRQLMQPYALAWQLAVADAD